MNKYFLITLIAFILIVSVFSTIVFASNLNKDGKSNIKDSDKDGIKNGKDKCPNTPRGLEVDRKGCSAAQFCQNINQDIVNDPYFMECWEADWKNNEPTGELGREDWRWDCKTWWTPEGLYCDEGDFPN